MKCGVEAQTRTGTTTFDLQLYYSRQCMPLFPSCFVICLLLQVQNLLRISIKIKSFVGLATRNMNLCLDTMSFTTAEA